MSYYYNYFIGYKRDNKFYPWGPYDANHELQYVVCCSRSFASDLYEDFYDIPENSYSEELKKDFDIGKDDENDEYFRIKYLPIKNLPNGDYIKRGYFLIKEVENYLHNHEEEFSSILSPEVYAAKVQNEIMFGKNKPIKDVDGYEYCEPNASDYMYFAYPNYSCKEYEAFLIKRAWEYLYDYNLDVEWVVLETEG